MTSFAEFHKQVAGEILSTTSENTEFGMKDEYLHAKRNRQASLMTPDRLIRPATASAVM